MAVQCTYKHTTWRVSFIGDVDEMCAPHFTLITVFVSEHWAK